jgi:hypothetical protein
MTGKWDFTVETPASGTGHPTVTIKQNGDDITGIYDSRIGALELQGTVNGQEFFFVVVTQQGDMKFTGKLDATGQKLEGTLDIDGRPPGRFVGKKQ